MPPRTPSAPNRAVRRRSRWRCDRAPKNDPHETAPEEIAYLHIDLNAAKAEIAALEFLFDRVTQGGLIVLDDYGHAPHQDQHYAEQEWMKDRGYAILELPSGQGLVVKH